MTEETLKQMGGEELLKEYEDSHDAFDLAQGDYTKIDFFKSELIRRLKAYEGIKKEIIRLRSCPGEYISTEEFTGQMKMADKILKSLES